MDQPTKHLHLRSILCSLRLHHSAALKEVSSRTTLVLALALRLAFPSSHRVRPGCCHSAGALQNTCDRRYGPRVRCRGFAPDGTLLLEHCGTQNQSDPHTHTLRKAPQANQVGTAVRTSHALRAGEPYRPRRLLWGRPWLRCHHWRPCRRRTVPAVAAAALGRLLLGGSLKLCLCSGFLRLLFREFLGLLLRKLLGLLCQLLGGLV